MSAAVVTEVKGDKQLEPESFALLNLLLDLLPGLAVTEPACCGDMKCGGSKVLKTEAHFVHMGQVSTAFRTALHCFFPSASSRRVTCCALQLRHLIYQAAKTVLELLKTRLADGWALYVKGHTDRSVRPKSTHHLSCVPC